MIGQQTSMMMIPKGATLTATARANARSRPTMPTAAFCMALAALATYLRPAFVPRLPLLPPLPLLVILEPPAIPSPRAAVGPPSLTGLFLRVHLRSGRPTAPPHLNLPPSPSSFPPPIPPPSFLCSVSAVPHTVRTRYLTSTSHPAAVVRRSLPPRHPPPSPSWPYPLFRCHSRHVSALFSCGPPR